MSLIYILIPAAVVLLVAYATYGRVLTRLLRLDPQRPTPAQELRDDLDYAPLETKALLPQHFSAIAAAGPIVGPILAGVAFGWLPALIWIIVGAIFIGGVHDMTALVASIRHKARSIAEVVRQHMSPRSYLLFLAFVWLALVYIIVAFTDITAAAFVGVQKLENGQEVTGPGIATSSLLYLLLPIAMGLLLRYTKLSVGVATLIFLPLVGVAIWIGQYIPAEYNPLNLARVFGVSDANAQKIWDVILLVYCVIAAVVPVWLLLQPRGYLGGYFLYAALLGGGLGLLLSGEPIRYEAFIGWTSEKGQPLFPLLFITIACGACSGFHAMIASGTTSKQLKRETDAKPIGYGSMLLEAMVAVVSLACVMILVKGSTAASGSPNAIYAQGIGRFLEAFSIPAALGVSFALMAFTTFVYDTLDVCTRLGRYIVQELTGWQGWTGKWLGTILTAGVPLVFVMDKTLDAKGNVVPAYMTFWSLFGASNQLLAALTLLGVTVWLWRTRRAMWVWFVTGIPTVFMYVMSNWALVTIIKANLASDWLLSRLTAEPLATVRFNPVLWVAVVLVGLALLMLVEAVLVFVRIQPPTALKPEPVGQAT
jgi:carbon starvation protein